MGSVGEQEQDLQGGLIRVGCWRRIWSKYLLYVGECDLVQPTIVYDIPEKDY